MLDICPANMPTLIPNKPPDLTASLPKHDLRATKPRFRFLRSRRFAPLLLHQSGVVGACLIGIGHREGRDRVVEHFALAGVASDHGRIAGARMGTREGATA